ncbi:MAG: hypothetical protein DRH10_05980 [Deltaproteobacteria bacterium]|nr:MAG: hypothetical protein DRH10_05980 [Deltaproteobacteria bacterium]
MISELKTMAIRGLKRMYRPDERLFVFRVRQANGGVVSEGLSRRYTAIVLTGLAGEGDELTRAVLGGHELHAVCDRLKEDAGRVDNLGDVALSLWAACAAGYPDCREIRERLLEFCPADKAYPVVEISWALEALCLDADVTFGDLTERLAHRLMSSFNEESGVFPHVLDVSRGPRSHVACFADMVYPIHALSRYYKLSGDRSALDAATQCAERICKLQGPAGQWWWHYDYRTGRVIEGYPVYSVHQDAMAPMALFALMDAGGPDFTENVQKGLHWLAHSPEHRASLIDNDADLIWRKVARREPGKLSRYAQAIASKIYPSFRVPGINVVFPPGAVDYENRPYHLGWLLYAWPEKRVTDWEKRLKPGLFEDER